MNTRCVSRLVAIALLIIAVMVVTEEVLRARTSTPVTMPPPAYSTTDITGSEATTKQTEKLTDNEVAHDHEIISVLQQQRLAVLTPGLPTWVRDHLIAFEKGEGQGEEDITFSRSIAWGIGWYEGKKFYWFAHASSDGWIQMDLSITLDEKDIDAINGIKLDDRKRVPMEDRVVDARVTEDLDTEGTATHLALNENGMDWTEEFCLRSNVTICNTAGAFEKYLLPAANSALPRRLMFVLRGRFPY